MWCLIPKVILMRDSEWLGKTSALSPNFWDQRNPGASYPGGDLRGEEGKHLPINEGHQSSSEGESESEGDEDMPLFLRRDIPPVEDAPGVHKALLALWAKRQAASLNLVQALNEDDVNLLEKLEDKMRRLNKQMHRIMQEYLKHLEQEEPAFVMIDDLPLPKGGPGSKQAYQQEGKEEIQIQLEYEGSQVNRKLKADAPKLDLHHLAIEYLLEVFGQPVGRFEDLSLTYEGDVIHFRGFINEIPILDGGTVVVQYSERENHTPRQQHNYGVPSSSCLGGSSRGNHQDENHPLTGARASSRPGNNGGAGLGGSSHRNLSAGYSQGEVHPLTGARAPSRPGNNGGALQFNDHHQPSAPDLPI